MTHEELVSTLISLYNKHKWVPLAPEIPAYLCVCSDCEKVRSIIRD